MTEKFKFKFDIPTIAIIMYALYAIKCVWLAFASLDYSPIYYYIMQIPLALCLVFGLLMLVTDKVEVPDSKLMIVLPFIFFAFSLFRVEDSINYVQTFFTLVIILLFVFFKSDIKIAIFDVFYWIIQVCNIFALIFFLCYLLNINIGFSITNYYSETINASYVKWLIFAIYRSSSEVRLCGIFNEPGGLGTVCALLFAARYNYSKTWEKLILILTIIPTFSLGGYIILIIYLYIFFINRDARLLFPLIICSIFFLIAPKIDWGNDYVNHFIGRFEITQNGLAGNNRTNTQFDIYFDNFRKSNDYYWGVKTLPKFYEIGSYKLNILKYGIVRFIFWVFSWCVAAFKQSNQQKECNMFIICFFISLLQRFPLIESIYGYVLLFGGIIWIQSHGEFGVNTNDEIETTRDIERTVC